LEYADSGTLNVYLKNHFNELDWNDKLRLAFQLASAVECIHNRGIIHRDLVMKNSIICAYLICYYSFNHFLYYIYIYSMTEIYLFIREILNWQILVYQKKLLRNQVMQKISWA
jgi:serine/threonine protein kinase